jgi:DNA-binding MltR family transcriptional regulator
MMSQDEELPNYGFEGNSLGSVPARAYYHSVVQSLRESTAKIDLQPERLKKVFAAARAEADRSAAILMFALAEDLMLTAIHRHCNTKVPGGWKDVTEGSGLLATANDRLTFLFIVNWIHPITHANLRLMKTIRNRLAHHADVEGFSDAKIRGAIGSMSPVERPMLDRIAEDGRPLPETIAPRHLFLMRSASAIVHLQSELAIAPEARAHQIAPGHVAGRWEDLPVNMRELNEISASHTVEVMKDATAAGANA